jgi:hypothetical protein
MGINREEPLMMERLIAAASYISMGVVGFVWLLIGIFTKSNLKTYLKYHIFQSIFISFLFYIIGILLGFIMNILSLIPFINQLVLQFTFYFNAPIMFGFSFIELIMYAILLYLAATSFMGQFSYIPWVSDIIKINVKNG